VFTNHIHADDLARIAWAALWKGKPRRVTNTVMQGPLKMGDYFDLVADQFGLARCPRVSRTELLEAVQRGEVSPMMASFMQDSRRVLGDRLNELGVRLHFSKIQDLIRSAGSQGT
jgi:nucleoside-diphosphate-sugar epimerase